LNVIVYELREIALGCGNTPEHTTFSGASRRIYGVDATPSDKLAARALNRCPQMATDIP